jgi:hypothetical protein
MLSLLRSTWGLTAVVLTGIVVLFVVGLLLVAPQGPTKLTTEPGRQPNEALDQAQELLATANDSATCRTALQQLNVRLSHETDRRPAPLTEEERNLLLDPKQLGLTPDELAEVENPSFSPLDAHHVDLCFLLQDVARALDVQDLSQPEQAAVAFAWVMRQVRTAGREEDLPAPEFVLHRGWGSARQRALIFVSLLEQLGIPACVLAVPAPENGPLSPWACGALTTLPGGRKEVLLFDPRLGLPLPGAKGPTAPELAEAFRLALPVRVADDRAPAGLAELRRRPDLLGALTTDERHTAGVSTGEIKGSCIYLAGMLSALAPRMKYLQEALPAARSGARVTYDPAGARATWKTVAAGLGEPAPEVRFWKEAARAESQFWPPEEGGHDRSNRVLHKLSELVPTQALPTQIAELEGEPRKRLQVIFNTTFVQFLLHAGMPPDLELHGQYDEAARLLVQIRDELREQKARLAAAVGLDEKIKEWSGQVIAAQAGVNRAEREAARAGGKDEDARAALEQARAELDRVWKSGEEVLSVLLEGRAAELRLPDATYLLALCKQEQAERLQRQLDHARRTGRHASEAEVQAAREAWADAGSWWGQYAGDLAVPADGGKPGAAPLIRRGSAPAARLLHARAREALGEHADALRLLQDLSGDLTDEEQTARLYLAKQLRKP